MERYFMLMDWKTQYCQDVSCSQCDLLIQCSPHQNLSKLFCGYFGFLKFIWKIANTALKEWNKVGGLTLHDSGLLVQLQLSIQCDNGEITDKQIKKTESSEINSQVMVNSSLAKEQRQSNGEKIVFHQMVLVRVDVHKTE